MSVYLQEAFKALDSILNEEDFNLGTIDGVKDAEEFLNDEEEIDFTDVMDPEATTEEEVKDSYVGDVILDCTVCHSKVYKSPDEVHIDEEEGLANTDEECPYCYSTDGYTIIGEVAPYGEKEEEVEETEDEEEVEEVEDEEEIEEALSKGQTVKFNGKSAKVLKVDKNDPDYGLIVDPSTGKKVWTNDFDESLNEGVSIQKGMTIKYDVDGNGTPDSCKVVDFKKGTNGKVAYVVLQPPKGDPIRVSADSLVQSNEKPVKKESLKRGLKESTENLDADINNSLQRGYKQKKPVLIFTSPGTGVYKRIKNWCSQNGLRPSVVTDSVISGDENSALIVLDFEKLSESKKLEIEESALKNAPKVGLIVMVANEGPDFTQAEKSNFEILDAHIRGSLKRGSNKFDDTYKPWMKESLKRRNRRNSMKEHFEKVEIETDSDRMEMTTDENGKVVVTTEPRRGVETGEEVIAPVSDEIQSEINPIYDDSEEDSEIENVDVMVDEENSEDYENIDVNEFSEEDFDELGESYLRRVYENVNSFKTTQVKVSKDKLIIEGVIGFKSGNKKKTSFIFESKDTDNKGRVRFIGENLQMSRGKKSFTLTGSINNGKFIAESLNYNYRQNGVRVYGTAKKR